MKTIHLLMAAAAGIALASPASAAATGDSATLNFEGTIDTSCDLSATDGALGADIGRTELSTRNGEGRPGIVSIKADEGFNLIVGEPTHFTTSDDSDLVVDFAGRVGSTELEPLVPYKLTPDDTLATVDVVVAKAAEGAKLGGGDYQVQVVVTCEPDLGPLVPM